MQPYIIIMREMPLQTSWLLQHLLVQSVYYMLNKNTQGAKKGEANQKQQLSSR